MEGYIHFDTIMDSDVISHGHQLRLLYNADSITNLLERFVIHQMKLMVILIILFGCLPLSTDVTDLDMKNMGMLSGIPNLTSALTLQLTGYVGDTLRSRYNFDTTKVMLLRKDVD